MDLNLSVSLWLPHWRLPNRFIGFFCFNQETTGYWLSRFPARHDIDLYQHSWDNLDELIFAIEQNLASAAGLGVILPSRENISMVDPALHGWLVKLGMQNDPTPGVEICTESNFSGHLTTMD